jgi:transcriptional regulator with XRE-family HTH domain
MRLSKALKLMRGIENIGVREQARAIGISPSTLSRIERGMPADPVAVIKLVVWLIGREAA